MAAVLMLSLAMVQSALGNLKTGGDLLNRAQARQRAEAGVDHALAYLDGKTTLSARQTLSGQGYSVTLTPQNNAGSAIRVESIGQAGLARHTAVAWCPWNRRRPPPRTPSSARDGSREEGLPSTAGWS